MQWVYTDHYAAAIIGSGPNRFLLMESRWQVGIWPLLPAGSAGVHRYFMGCLDVCFGSIGGGYCPVRTSAEGGDGEPGGVGPPP